MDKRIKFLLIFLGIIALIVTVFVIAIDLDSGKNDSSNIPIEDTKPLYEVEMIVEEKQKLIEFVENFILLYNTYSYEDYSNLLALGDYETQNAQKQTLERIEDLKKITPVAFAQNVEKQDILELKKEILLKVIYSVSVNFTVMEEIVADSQVSPRSSDVASQNQKQLTATLKILPFGNGFLVDEIRIND